MRCILETRDVLHCPHGLECFPFEWRCRHTLTRIRWEHRIGNDDDRSEAVDVFLTGLLDSTQNLIRFF